MRKKIHVAQNKGGSKFQEVKWLPTKEKVERRVATDDFKFWKGTLPFYVNEFFVHSSVPMSCMALGISFKKSNLGQKKISFMGPSIWNKLSNAWNF